MTAKHLLFESAARDAVLRGAAAMANAVKVTLGPKSKCVLIERRWDRPVVCNDGVTIAKEMELADPEENLGELPALVTQGVVVQVVVQDPAYQTAWDPHSR